MRIADGFDLIEAWRKSGGLWVAWFCERGGGIKWAALKEVPSISYRNGDWIAEIPAHDGNPLFPPERIWGIVPTGDGHGLLASWYPKRQTELIAQNRPVSVEVDWLRAHKENDR